MKYKFKSIFDRSKEYTIEAKTPLHLYDTFHISINKFDNDIKSYAYENIICTLKCSKQGELDIVSIELDNTNFSGYYMMVETFKKRECVKLGEGIELVKEEPFNEFKNATLDNSDKELVLAFNKFIKDNNVMNILFQGFLQGVSYGKTNDK